MAEFEKGNFRLIFGAFVLPESNRTNRASENSGNESCAAAIVIRTACLRFLFSIRINDFKQSSAR
jgi:hypothetical protein